MGRGVQIAVVGAVLAIAATFGLWRAAPELFAWTRARISGPDTINVWQCADYTIGFKQEPGAVAIVFGTQYADTLSKDATAKCLNRKKTTVVSTGEKVFFRPDIDGPFLLSVKASWAGQRLAASKVVWVDLGDVIPACSWKTNEPNCKPKSDDSRAYDCGKDRTRTLGGLSYVDIPYDNSTLGGGDGLACCPKGYSPRLGSMYGHNVPMVCKKN